MSDDPLDAVYSFVERAYIRLQAGDVLIRCLEEGSSAPMQQMVESLVLAGPQSLNAMREMLAEAGQRKSQVLDDINQVFNQFENNLKSYGVYLDEVKNGLAVLQLTPVSFLAMLREQGITEEETQITCLQILHENRELIISLANHVRLLEEIETFLADWLWGLAYQSAHQVSDDKKTAY
ncbi:MAG: hypothetical protein EHM70_12565 [Chloroflexota bacterium]|nr:MAG: hypothetical protein EHM70_12565 [Chloroflexota bacterium]